MLHHRQGRHLPTSFVMATVLSEAHAKSADMSRVDCSRLVARLAMRSGIAVERASPAEISSTDCFGVRTLFFLGCAWLWSDGSSCSLMRSFPVLA